MIIDLSNVKLLNMRQLDEFFQKQNQNAQNIHGRLTPHFAPLWGPLILPGQLEFYQNKIVNQF